MNTDGLLIGDGPVVAKAQIVYRLPWGVMVSANLQHQTGRAYARQVRVSGLGFPTAPQINMEPNTGDRRVADINLIDMRAQKEFTLTAADEASPCSSTRSTRPTAISRRRRLGARHVDRLRRADAVHPAAPHPDSASKSVGKGDTHHENRSAHQSHAPWRSVCPHPRSPEASATAPSRPRPKAHRRSRWRRDPRARPSSTRARRCSPPAWPPALGFISDKNGEFSEFGEATSPNKKLGAAGLAAAFAGGTMMFLGSRGVALPADEPSASRRTALRLRKKVSW